MLCVLTHHSAVPARQRNLILSNLPAQLIWPCQGSISHHLQVFFVGIRFPIPSSNSIHIHVARCGFFFKVPAYILACKTTDQIGRYHLNIWVETYSFESYRQSFGISLEKETCATSSWDFYKLLCREHGIGLSATWIGADLKVYVSLITSFSASEAVRVW